MRCGLWLTRCEVHSITRFATADHQGSAAPVGRPSKPFCPAFRLFSPVRTDRTLCLPRRGQAGWGLRGSDEECRIDSETALGPSHHFHVHSGRWKAPPSRPCPPRFPTRLFLVAASGVPEFRPVFDALSRIEVYNSEPTRDRRDAESPNPGDLLRETAANGRQRAAAVSDEPRLRVTENLSRIVPGVSDAETKTKRPA